MDKNLEIVVTLLCHFVDGAIAHKFPTNPQNHLFF